MNSDNFVNVPLVPSNIDRYLIRSSILKAIADMLPQVEGKLLDVGCGKMPYKKFILERSSVTEYVGLDIESALVYDEVVKPDYYWDGKCMPFQSNTFDCCLATEVLEHCPDPLSVLKEIHRTLKPGGTFYFTVPFLWNLHEVPNDEFRYTPYALQRLLISAGFENICIQSTGGWHLSMAQMLGMWIRRSPINKLLRALLSYGLFPLYLCLLKIGRREKSYGFTEGQMVTGLRGRASK